MLRLLLLLPAVLSLVAFLRRRRRPQARGPVGIPANDPASPITTATDEAELRGAEAAAAEAKRQAESA